MTLASAVICLIAFDALMALVTSATENKYNVTAPVILWIMLLPGILSLAAVLIILISFIALLSAFFDIVSGNHKKRK